MNNADKTVFVLNQFTMPLSHAGGTRHVELFGGLENWETRIFAGSRTNAGQRLKAGGMFTTVPVTPFRGNGPGRIVSWLSYSVGVLIRAGVTRKAPSVVYGSSPHMGAAVAALAISKLRRRPFVLEVRDLWPHILTEAGALDDTGVPYRLLKKLERLLYRHADRIVILAEGSEGPILAEGADPEKIVFIPNCADPDDFLPSGGRQGLRKRYGFNRFTVVYTGAHGPANGLHLLLDAAEELQREGREIDVVLYGNGVQKPQLKERAVASGLNSVEFRDPVAKAEIPDILHAADVGLHCLADFELFKTGVSPNKLYDYMAAGLPVLTNNLGDMAAMVNRAKSGLAVAPHGLADGIRQLLAMSQDDRDKLGSAGQQFMSDERSRSAMTKRLEKVLDDVLLARSH